MSYQKLSKEFRDACSCGDLEWAENTFSRLNAMAPYNASRAIHSFDDFAFRHAALNGHFAVVDFLVKNGATIYAQCNYVLRYTKSKSIYTYMLGLYKLPYLKDLLRRYDRCGFPGRRWKHEIMRDYIRNKEYEIVKSIYDALGSTYLSDDIII